MLGCSFQAFSSSEPVLKFRSFSEFLLTSHFQVLVSTAKPCDSTDERLIIHHVSPPPPLPLHLHLRPAGDAGGQSSPTSSHWQSTFSSVFRRPAELPRGHPNLKLRLHHQRAAHSLSGPCQDLFGNTFHRISLWERIFPRQVLTGEDWNNVMYTAIRSKGGRAGGGAMWDPWLSSSLSLIIVDYPWLSSSLSLIIVDYRWLSLIIIDYHRLSSIIVDYHWLSFIIIDYHWLSLIIIDYHWSLLIIIDYHWLSLITIDYHWLSLDIIDYM